MPGAKGKVLPFTNWGLERSANRQANATLNGTRLPAKTDQGDPTLAGPFSSILDLRTIGYWLALALGVPTVRKAVSTQPVNVTGVTVQHANAACAAGNGTLSYTAAGTTATWTPNGGAAGAAVNIGAGGNFTLQGGAANSDVRISVVAASLPVGNVNDANISVHATLKAHSFPLNVAALPSGLFEMQHGDLAAPKYYRSTGIKVGDIGSDVFANDQSINGTLIGAEETEQVAVFDGAPTQVQWARACAGRGRLSDGAAGLGTCRVCRSATASTATA